MENYSPSTAPNPNRSFPWDTTEGWSIIDGLTGGRFPYNDVVMAKPAKCAHCNQPATIHLTQIQGGEIKKLDLCEKCPFKEDVGMGVDLEPFTKLAESVVAGQSKGAADCACPGCGTDGEAFRETGRFGCTECYDAFAPVLQGMLEGMQPGATHEGKIPAKGVERRENGLVRANLRRDLESAVREERFEDAAVLRDRLRNFGEEEDGESEN